MIRNFLSVKALVKFIYKTISSFIEAQSPERLPPKTKEVIRAMRQTIPAERYHSILWSRGYYYCYYSLLSS